MFFIQKRMNKARSGYKEHISSVAMDVFRQVFFVFYFCRWLETACYFFIASKPLLTYLSSDFEYISREGNTNHWTKETEQCKQKHPGSENVMTFVRWTDVLRPSSKPVNYSWVTPAVHNYIQKHSEEENAMKK